MDFMHLYVHIHLDTSSFTVMSMHAYIMMMMIIMPRMTFKGLLSSKLQTVSSTMMDLGGANLLESTLVRVGRV